MKNRFQFLYGLLLPVMLWSGCLLEVYGEVFVFQYAAGEQYRILSTVAQKVYINGDFSHSADVLNKIAVRVGEVKDGSGRISATYQTSERSYGQNQRSYQWSEEYSSEFWRDQQGRYTIHPDYYMPVLRDVPVFPTRDLQPGDTWVSRAEEVHDLRRVFQIEEAFHIPVTVAYEYRGRVRLDGREYDRFLVEYTLFHKPALPRYGNPLFPVLITGFSRQDLYWDRENGRPHYSTEEFDLIWELSSGERIEYMGMAEGRVIESPRMDKEGLASDIRKTLEQRGVRDARVDAEDEGVTITLENIQFLPDSAVLLSREKVKLDLIGEILSRYPERDVLISGHTAMAGTAEGRQLLSEERARAVADYLIALGVRNEERIVSRGLGATKPLASNASEAGRRRNRRVEITILEN